MAHGSPPDTKCHRTVETEGTLGSLRDRGLPGPSRHMGHRNQSATATGVSEPGRIPRPTRGHTSSDILDKLAVIKSSAIVMTDHALNRCHPCWRTVKDDVPHADLGVRV